VTQVVVFFLASLLHCHVLVQDMIVQTVCNSGLGLLAVGMIGLFAIHPALPVAVLVGLLVLVGSLLMIASGKHSELRSRLASVTATKPSKDNSVSHSSGGIITSPPLVSSPQPPALEPSQSPSNSQERPRMAEESSQEDSNDDVDSVNDESLSENSSVSSGSSSEGSPCE
jgi:hypothetical protein